MYRYLLVDLIDALHSAPEGYYSSMWDPTYALASSGSVIVFNTGGADLLTVCRGNVETALPLIDDPEFEDADIEADQWEDIRSRLSALETELFSRLDDPADPMVDYAPEDVANALRTMFVEADLPEHAATVEFGRHMVTFRAVGW